MFKRKHDINHCTRFWHVLLSLFIYANLPAFCSESQANEPPGTAASSKGQKSSTDRFGLSTLGSGGITYSSFNLERVTLEDLQKYKDGVAKAYATGKEKNFEVAGWSLYLKELTYASAGMSQEQELEQLDLLIAKKKFQLPPGQQILAELGQREIDLVRIVLGKDAVPAVVTQTDKERWEVEYAQKKQDAFILDDHFNPGDFSPDSSGYYDPIKFESVVDPAPSVYFESEGDLLNPLLGWIVVNLFYEEGDLLERLKKRKRAIVQKILASYPNRDRSFLANKYGKDAVAAVVTTDALEVQVPPKGNIFFAPVEDIDKRSMKFPTLHTSVFRNVFEGGAQDYFSAQMFLFGKDRDRQFVIDDVLKMIDADGKLEAIRNDALALNSRAGKTVPGAASRAFNYLPSGFFRNRDSLVAVYKDTLALNRARIDKLVESADAVMSTPQQAELYVRLFSVRPLLDSVLLYILRNLDAAQRTNPELAAAIQTRQPLGDALFRAARPVSFNPNPNSPSSGVNVGEQFVVNNANLNDQGARDPEALFGSGGVQGARKRGVQVNESNGGEGQTLNNSQFAGVNLNGGNAGPGGGNPGGGNPGGGAGGNPSTTQVVDLTLAGNMLVVTGPNLTVPGTFNVSGINIINKKVSAPSLNVTSTTNPALNGSTFAGNVFCPNIPFGASNGTINLFQANSDLNSVTISIDNVSIGPSPVNISNATGEVVFPFNSTLSPCFVNGQLIHALPP